MRRVVRRAPKTERSGLKREVTRGWKDGSALKTQSAFAEEPYLVPNPHFGWLTTTCDISTWGISSLWPLGTTHMHTPTHGHIIKFFKKIKVIA